MSSLQARQEVQEGLSALINYTVICAKQCNALRGHDDTLSESEAKCLSNSDFSTLFFSPHYYFHHRLSLL